MVAGGDFIFRDGKWIPHITLKDGVVQAIGKYATREEAAKAYMAKVDELYPASPPPKVDPTKHHGLVAGDLITKPFKLT